MVAEENDSIGQFGINNLDNTNRSAFVFINCIKSKVENDNMHIIISLNIFVKESM